MDQTEPLAELEAAQVAAHSAERERDQEAWTQFAGQVRDEWAAAADRMGQVLMDAGHKIQKEARSFDAGAGSPAMERMSAAALQGRTRLLEAAAATAGPAGMVAQELQKGINDMASNFADTLMQSRKQARRSWARTSNDLNDTLHHTRKRAMKNWSKTTADLADTMQATGKTAGKQFEQLGDTVGDFVESTASQLPFRKTKAKAGFGKTVAKGVQYMLIARMGTKGAKSLMKADAKKMKLFSRSRKQRRSSSLPWFAAAGLGAGLMYFLDPDRGARRREWLNGQVKRLTGSGEQSYPGWPAMQGTRMGGTTGMYGQETTPMWAGGARLLAGVAGGLLAVSGVTSGGFMGAARSAAGLGLLALGSRLRVPAMGSGTVAGERPVDASTIQVDKSIVVHAPVHDVFNFWSRFDNFGRFMSHVIEVRNLGDNRSHWVVEGPAGTHVSWDARTTRMVTDSQIAWESEPGAMVGNAGVVRFTPLANGETRVDVHMTYSPPAGVVGQAVASFFGSNARQEMDDDLAKFKSLVERADSSGASPDLTTGPQHFVLGE